MEKYKDKVRFSLGGLQRMTSNVLFIWEEYFFIKNFFNFSEEHLNFSFSKED